MAWTVLIWPVVVSKTAGFRKKLLQSAIGHWEAEMNRIQDHCRQEWGGSGLLSMVGPELGQSVICVLIIDLP